jgi:hypothetical protein
MYAACGFRAIGNFLKKIRGMLKEELSELLNVVSGPGYIVTDSIFHQFDSVLHT